MKGGFIKALEQDQHKGLLRDSEEQLMIYYGVGGGKDEGNFLKDFHIAKEDSQDPGALAIFGLRWCFPLRH